MSCILHLQEPADAAALAPYLLGSDLADGLVVMALRGVVISTLTRLDLPADIDDDPDLFREALARIVTQLATADATTAVLIGSGPQLAQLLGLLDADADVDPAGPALFVSESHPADNGGDNGASGRPTVTTDPDVADDGPTPMAASPLTDRQYLDIVLKTVRSRYPTATAAEFETSDQDYYGFVLTDVLLSDDALLSATDPDGLSQLAEDVIPESSSILWDSVMNESDTGHATIAVPHQPGHPGPDEDARRSDHPGDAQ